MKPKDLAALPWPAFALLALPLVRPLKRGIARRKMRARTWEYLIAEGDALQIARLGTSGAGAFLVVCRDTVGPERIGDAVRRALQDGAVDPALLLATLPGALCVANGESLHTAPDFTCS